MGLCNAKLFIEFSSVIVFLVFGWLFFVSENSFRQIFSNRETCPCRYMSRSYLVDVALGWSTFVARDAF